MFDHYRPTKTPFGLTTPGTKPSKDQLQPGVTAGHESVTIIDRNYQVIFYLYFARSGAMVFNGVSIKGWPDNDSVDTVLATWGIPEITKAYADKLMWLAENPGFKTPIVKKTPQKRVYASEVG
jgi:hypothetical protein